MNPIYKFIIFCSIVLMVCSCENIVDLDLKVAEPRNIVDASITEGMPCMVILTKSHAFQNNEPYERIPNATIELTTSNGHSETMIESRREPGVYTSTLIGKPGITYHLKIMLDDEVYEASATVPDVVHIERVYIYEIKAGDKSWYSPAITYRDPEYEKNYYYVLLSVNDKLMRSIYLYDDDNRDGVETPRILFFDKEDNDDEDLKTGDLITVELQSIDVGMYRFYKSLSSVAEGTNAITNFTGGALGCFKAYNSSIGQAIVSQDIVE